MLRNVDRKFRTRQLLLRVQIMKRECWEITQTSERWRLHAEANSLLGSKMSNRTSKASRLSQVTSSQKMETLLSLSHLDPTLYTKKKDAILLRPKTDSSSSKRQMPRTTLLDSMSQLTISTTMMMTSTIAPSTPTQMERISLLLYLHIWNSSLVLNFHRYPFLRISIMIHSINKQNSQYLGTQRLHLTTEKMRSQQKIRCLVSLVQSKRRRIKFSPANYSRQRVRMEELSH